MTDWLRDKSAWSGNYEHRASEPTAEALTMPHVQLSPQRRAELIERRRIALEVAGKASPLAATQIEE